MKTMTDASIKDQHYQYEFQNGDQPLAGYTIEHALGRGGFGEVYFARSEQGKELALKVIMKGEQVELRGIRQCMNLKSPHLVTIYDIQQNDQGRWFVLMEYVNGPSLSDLIDQHKGGMPREKAFYFLCEMAKGLSYLHEAGIVHRDLKPENIFYENGYVKICDYGLSKSIGATAVSGQTITVGTLHYMAPEIGDGCYDRSIDIYAMGVVLYEMLKGEVPYGGSSPAEVIMQHVRGEPDLSGLEDPVAGVVRKALAKRPEDRYQSVQEFIESVFDVEHIRESLAHFKADSINADAAKAAEKVKAAFKDAKEAAARDEQEAKEASEAEAKLEAPVAPLPSGDELAYEYAKQAAEQIVRIESASAPVVEGVVENATASQSGFKPQASSVPEAKEFKEHLNIVSRLFMAFVTAILIGLGCGMMNADLKSQFGFQSPEFRIGCVVAMSIFVGSIAAYLSYGRLGQKLRSENWLVRRLSFGGLSCLLLMGATSPVILHFWGDEQILLRSTVFALTFPLFMINWINTLRPNRDSRMQFGKVVIAGLCGAISIPVFGAEVYLALATSMGLCLGTMALCPWHHLSAAKKGEA